MLCAQDHRTSAGVRPPSQAVVLCSQSSPASRSFPMSQFFASGGQRIGVSASASVLPMNIHKTIALTRRTFVGKVMSLLLNVLSRLVTTILPRRKCLLNSWLQSPSALNDSRGKQSSITQTRRGLTLLSQPCRDPAVGVRNGEEA